MSSPCSSSVPASSSLESHPLLGHLSQVWTLVGDQMGTSSDIPSACPCLESVTDDLRDIEHLSDKLKLHSVRDAPDDIAILLISRTAGTEATENS